MKKKNNRTQNFNFYWIYAGIALIFIALQFVNTVSSPLKKINKQKFLTEMLVENEVEKVTIVNNEYVEVHLKKYRPEGVSNFQLPLLGQLSKDFSGAEIEAVVIESMRLGFNENREFNNEDVLISIQNLVPLARTKSKEIDLLL